MTGTKMDCELAMAFTEYVPNRALAQVADECLHEVGAPKWDEADYQLAREFINSYDEETTAVIHQKIRKKYGADHLEEVLRHPLSTQVEPFDSSRLLLESGSTDVGDVGFRGTDHEPQRCLRLHLQRRTHLADDCTGVQLDCTQGSVDRRKGTGSGSHPHQAPSRGHRCCQSRGSGAQRWKIPLSAA